MRAAPSPSASARARDPEASVIGREDGHLARAYQDLAVFCREFHIYSVMEILLIFDRVLS
jgi:hypothetical protein